LSKLCVDRDPRLRGSIILARPPAIRDLRASVTVGIDVNDGCSVIVLRP
jgi:hypothetical protein